MAFAFGWLKDRAKSFLDWEKIEGVLTPELCDQHKQEEGTPMLLDQATSRNVSRALNEINGFDWEGDFKPMALQAAQRIGAEAARRRDGRVLRTGALRACVGSAGLPQWVLHKASANRDGRFRAVSAAPAQRRFSH